MEGSFEVVDIGVAPEFDDLLCDVLWTLGVAGIEERSRDTSAVVYRTSFGTDPQEGLKHVRDRIPQVQCTMVPVDRGSIEMWRQFVSPTWVDEVTVFVPAWLESPTVESVVRIEPFDTFGLGNHPTTVLAARLSLRAVRDGNRVVDLGCGSGILAILLAMRANVDAMVFDIAPGCRAAVEHNMRLNDIEPHRILWFEGLASLDAESVDVVVANILAPVLRSVAAEIVRVLSPRGCVILSGMRTDQVEQVIAEYPSCVVEASELSEGWAAVTLRKTADTSRGTSTR